MMIRRRFAAAVMGVASFVFVGSVPAMNWQKVYDARDKGLPKTAIEELKPIMAEALRNKRYPEAIKAITTTIAFEGQVEGGKAEEKVTRLEAEIAKAPVEMRPVMEAILAHWYWSYFQQNRWRFSQRTSTTEAPGKDFTTWDLPRILAEIDRHFSAALAGEQQLKSIPIAEFNDLLEKNTVPDAYRPTLYDFLVYEALEFYQAGEQGGAKAEDEFEMTVDRPVFRPASEYLKWKPETTDVHSAKLKAIRLFQNLLAFHQGDADRSAFLDADLARLVFANNQTVGADKNARYKEALQRLAEGNQQHEISAQARYLWAEALAGEDEPEEARGIAVVGRDAFPGSFGGINCYNLIQRLESKSASIATERVWNAPWPSIRVTYRNVDKVYFRVVAYDFEATLKTQRWGYGFLDENQQKELLGRVAVKTWAADLPVTKDLKERTEEVPVPQDLPPGSYFVFASHDEAFGGKNSQLSYAPVWVSDLALIVRQRQPYGGAVDGFVLNANSGAPLNAAKVRLFTCDRNGRYQEGSPVTTDENGLFRISKLANEGYNNAFLIASHGGQQVASGQAFGFYAQPAANSLQQNTVFFTDRSLYRPGQAVQFKGICYQVDREKNDYRVLAGQSLTVLFRDPNGKDISRLQVKCNDYGAFSGSFTAPGDRVMGQMSLLVQGGPHGSTSFNVEEYKRPKFQVELEKPKEAAKLGLEVVLTGKATAYTGAAIGGAKVSWRVVREVRFPDWCWWGRFCLPPGFGNSQNIAHGSLTTGSEGSFKVKFMAMPDLSVAEKTEPIFSFQVYADVTDSTGETRSHSQVVQVGYTALKLSLGAEDWQTPDTPVIMNLSSTTLDGEPQSVSGNVKIHEVKQPAKVLRPVLQPQFYDYRWWGRQLAGNHEPKPDPSNVDSWELGAVVAEQSFKTDATGGAKVSVTLKAGLYRAMVETRDAFGKSVSARRTLQVVDVKAKNYPVHLANFFSARKWSVEPGENFQAVWGTGYDAGRAFVELEQNGKLLKSWWTAADHTQEAIEQSVTEELRGGFSLRVTYVRENRAYLNERVVDVPWSNKRLAVKWERFVSKLGPGQKETWTAVVTGPDSAKSVAEMVAGLYDASLDQYLPHVWMSGLDVFRHERDRVNATFENSLLNFNQINGFQLDQKYRDWRYRSFPAELKEQVWAVGFGYGYRLGGRARKAGGEREMTAIECAAAPMNAMCMDAAAAPQDKRLDRALLQNRAKSGPEESPAFGGAAAPDLNKVTARKNLNETAFFFPHLLSDTSGVVKMEFTMPEALTEWKFMGFAHDKDLRSGFLTDKAVTSKDLMVEPNPPRFVREGDVVEFTVKVSNQSAARQTGKVRLTLADARTLKEVNAECGVRNTEYEFNIPAKESKSFSWRLSIPDGMDFMTYKAVGATDRLSDGEEGFLPVLSRRILVTESLPLPIRGAQTKKFNFTRLSESGRSKTLKSESLTVQMVSQPAWYAVMALPYLMEYPYECCEQTFNRLYANMLAQYIANADPKIRRIFDLWKNTPALDSPLEKNQDLKSVMLEETPWLRQANDESQARRNVGILFDANRLDNETRQTFRKLSEMQLDDGLWPWFPGFRGDEYMTLYIVTGFGRLRHLGVEKVDVSAALKALGALDGWVDQQYRDILKHGDPDKNHLTSTIAFYLYGRSFFLTDKPVGKTAQEAVNYFLGQARKYWVELKCRQSQGHLAIALKRFGDTDTPVAIMKSIKEYSVSSEELGMFWRDTELSWWWFRAPIETQALMIEAFDEVMGDAAAVEDCKVWLLKQKQTQDWKTTKATADAVYGLMLRGRNLLSSDALVEVSLGREAIKPEKVEAGTGFYEKKFIRSEIKPSMGAITVKKTDEGVSWGSVHWQYLEDMTKVTPYEGTPLQLKKTLFIKENSKSGPVLKPVKGALAVGDELVVRVELRVDRDMEYVHLKDQRGCGVEPVNVLSQTKYQDGLLYYESTRDTASHFFIHYLPKGVYVFEYNVRVQLRGNYQTGVASIQCMYAPEFNSHSGSMALEVR